MRNQPIISQNLASIYFAQRFLSLEFSTCFLSFITLAASSSLPFFPCISSHFPCSCPLPSHDFLLMCLSSLYPPPRIHTSTCADGGLALFLSDGWKCQHCEGDRGENSQTACEAVELLWPRRLTDGPITMAWQKVFPGFATNGSIHGFLQVKIYLLPLSHYLFFFFFTELPPGWEKIDDPVYGVYYVE